MHRPPTELCSNSLQRAWSWRRTCITHTPYVIELDAVNLVIVRRAERHGRAGFVRQPGASWRPGGGLLFLNVCGTLPGGRHRESTDGCEINPGLLPCAEPGRRYRLSQAGVGIAGMPIWLCRFRGGQYASGNSRSTLRRRDGLNHLSVSSTVFIRIRFQDCLCRK